MLGLGVRRSRPYQFQGKRKCHVRLICVPQAIVYIVDGLFPPCIPLGTVIHNQATVTLSKYSARNPPIEFGSSFFVCFTQMRLIVASGLLKFTPKTKLHGCLTDGEKAIQDLSVPAIAHPSIA